MGEYTSYWLYQKYETRGDQTPIPVYPNTYSVDGDGTMNMVVKIENDPSCGYEPTGMTQYRWVNIPITQDYICDECPIFRWQQAPATDYTCSGTTKYYKEYYQVSYDGGTTWENVQPEQWRQGGVIETLSEDCGYVPAEPIYEWEQSNETVCVSGDTPTPPTPTSGSYLTFVALENGTFTFSASNSNSRASYSLDNGVTWVSGNSDSITTPEITAGQKVLWKANFYPPAFSYKGGGTFSSTGYYNVEGNVMSLLYGDNFVGQTVIDKERAFTLLFYGNTKLVNASSMSLPGTTLTSECYKQMFGGCSSLVAAPSLPATTLAYGCYEDMFSYCTLLTTAPELPAETLVAACYKTMFFACSNLSSIKCLATDISSSECVYYWTSSVAANGTFIKASSMSSWTTGDSGIPSGWTVQNAQ